MKIAFYTLGCKTNQAETAAMEQIAEQAGHTLVSFDDAADLYIVNTCTVTALADKKSRQALRRARKTNPASVVAVCGCFSQNAGNVLLYKGLADIVSGNRNHHAFLSSAFSAAEKAIAHNFHIGGDELPADAGSKPGTDDSPGLIVQHDADTADLFSSLPAGSADGRTRALLKIQDGCDNYCTYCIIPYVRGHVRCIAPKEAVFQAGECFKNGYRELVLTGIEISSYHYSGDKQYNITDLIDLICAHVPTMRIRLGSLEPRTPDAMFCKRLPIHANLCPHFHLSLQSGCDATLVRMHRRYTTAQYYDTVIRLRNAFPGCTVTTDLICGFPGETEAEFSETLNFLEKCRFARVHVFPYSKRAGTPAAAMPGQISRDVKEDRCRCAAGLSSTVALQAMSSYIGCVLPVLVEHGIENGLLHGYTPNYLPVFFAGDEALQGQEVPVRLTQAIKGRLLGNIAI